MLFFFFLHFYILAIVGNNIQFQIMPNVHWDLKTLSFLHVHLLGKIPYTWIRFVDSIYLSIILGSHHLHHLPHHLDRGRVV